MAEAPPGAPVRRPGPLPVAPVRLLLAAIGVVALAAFLLTADPRAIWSTLGRTRPAGLAAAAACVVLSVLVKAARWQWLVRQASGARVPFRAAVPQILAGVSAGSVVPSRAIEPAKPLMLRSSAGTPLGVATGAVLFERMLDGLSMLVLFWVFAARAPVGGVDRGLAASLSLAGLAGVGAVLAFPLAFGRVAARAAGRIAPRLAPGAANLFATLLAFRGGLVWPAAAASLIAASLDVVRASIVLRAAGLDLPAAAVGLSVAGSSLFAGVSFIPGGIGVAELSQAGLLAAAGAPVRAAGAAVLLDRVVGYYLVVLAGAVVLLAARPQESPRRSANP